ncbi:MAG: alpha/beta hydrolase, partial [Candidatus Limnocylindrales bacterium]
DTAREMPDRVRSLILVASSPSGFQYESPELDEMWAEMERIEESRDWPTLVRREVEIWTDGIGQSPDRVSPDIRERMTRWGLENYMAEPGYGKPRLFTPPAVHHLAEVAQPTLVMWGDLDEPSTQKGSEAMAAGIPGARSHTFAGVAHMVDLERPQAFERLVLDFLAEVDAV